MRLMDILYDSFGYLLFIVTVSYVIGILGSVYRRFNRIGRIWHLFRINGKAGFEEIGLGIISLAGSSAILILTFFMPFCV
jgi:hypothetical protein